MNALINKAKKSLNNLTEADLLNLLKGKLGGVKGFQVIMTVRGQLLRD